MTRLVATVGLLMAGCGPGPPVTGLYAGVARGGGGECRGCVFEVFPTGPGRVHVTLECPCGLEDGDGAEAEPGGILSPDGGGLLRLEDGWLVGTLCSAAGLAYLVEGERMLQEMRNDE